VFPNSGSITRSSPSLLTGFPGAGFPAFNRYYERTKTSGSRLVKLAPYDTSLGLHRFVSLLQAQCSSGAQYCNARGYLYRQPLPGLFSRRRNLDLPGSQDTLVYICPALGPRTDLYARPLERFGAAPAITSTKAPSIILISRLNHTAFVPAVYASCRHLCRLRKTRFRLVVNLYRWDSDPLGVDEEFQHFRALAHPLFLGLPGAKQFSFWP
jgi:hypothetical protein